jgi:LmbE family N-acetylglucosaminyl deacetylase
MMGVNAIISQFNCLVQKLMMNRKAKKTVVIIVAHPDDETLWAGGTILSHPSWSCFIVCLCRGSDKERSTKFRTALKVLKSKGIMGDLDDGPDQKPLDENEIERTIFALLPPWHFDLIITHNPGGEYTRHIRHEETGKVVTKLWKTGKLSASELWTFAYEDGNKEYYPRPVKEATIYQTLSKWTWHRKFRIITRIYGFVKGSFEAETTPRAESFWQFRNSEEAH